MPRVLFISYAGTYGGAERTLLDFTHGMAADRALACPAGRLTDEARSAGVAVYPLATRALQLRGSASDRVRAVAALAAHAREARRLIENLDPDVVVTWGMRSALACLLLAPPGQPVVFQHHDLLPGPLIGRAVRRSAARAALVLCPSHAVARDLNGRDVRIAVVHPGVDAARFDPSLPVAEPPTVLVLGALVRWKRPDLALEAVALARRALPGLRLRIVGGALDGEGDSDGDGDALSGELTARARAQDLDGAVDLTGPVADPAAEIAAATCLLHCAPREPFGLVIVEALASGRPAVVPDAGGPAEIVEPSCGRRYEPGDAASAAAALVEVVSDPALARDLGRGGRERARRAFSVERSRARWAGAALSVARPDTRRRISPANLAIVTVTHNSAAELRRLLASVARHLPGVRVVVVDSGSRDDSLAIARETPGAHAIDLGRNAGFGAGTNVGVAVLSEPVAALLNPDVELIDDSLLELAAIAPGTPERLFAPLVLNPDGTRQDTVHPRPTSAADLLRTAIPYTVLARPAAVPFAPWRATAARPVGWAVGCALIAATTTLRRLGPFDPGIFLYGEDLELGLRAAGEGVPTWFWPSARVVHTGGHAAERAFGGEAFEALARARRAVVVQHLGGRRMAVDDAAQALTFRSRIAVKELLGRSARRERRQLGTLRRLRAEG